MMKLQYQRYRDAPHKARREFEKWLHDIPEYLGREEHYLKPQYTVGAYKFICPVCGLIALSSTYINHSYFRKAYKTHAGLETAYYGEKQCDLWAHYWRSIVNGGVEKQ